MFVFGSRVLVVAAHPDDESLGCGATISRLTASGVQVDVMFLSDGESSRLGLEQPEERMAKIEKRRLDAEKALTTLGVNSFSFADFEDNQMDGVPLLRVSKTVEEKIFELNPNFLLTHSGVDLNVDHKACLQACLVASRPTPLRGIVGLASFEVPSSTGWDFAHSNNFRPNVFVDVSDFMTKKIEALGAYGEEIHDFPHARSIRGVESLATYRGVQTGVAAAEAFELHRISL